MLLERADELRALDTVLDTGGVLVIEGGAGIGKTSLLRLGSERAARSGWRVLRGTGSELETGFAFGVVRQLFERELAAAEPARRAQWLAGPAAAVRGLLGSPDAAPDPFAVVHGLYWLTVNMAAGQPVLIAVDDAHWADPASLRWLAYLASRVEGPGVAVVVALRPAEPASRQGPLAKIRTAAPAIRPALLSAAGVAAIVRATLGAGTPDATCQALREASGGNPFYLGELLRAQSAADPGGGGLPASEAVARHVEARIRRLDPAALGLAQALAVLGDEAQLRHAMAMTGLDTDPAVRLTAGIIRRGYDAFARADLPAVFEMLDAEITWHVPGSSPLSGDYKGHGEVGGFFARTMELSGGTFAIDIQDVLAAGERVVVLCTVSAERHGQSWSSPEVHVWRVTGGRAVDFCEFQGDEHTEDAFWSA